MKFIVSLVCLMGSAQLLAAEKSFYDFSWLDSDKEVYVLQNRKFRKDKKFYVGGQAGVQINGAFIDSNEVSAHAGFFFREDWGFEVSYTKAFGSTNKTHDAVNAQGSVAFYREVDTAVSAMAIWSPFYAKINTFNKIFYYDWMFGAGLANVTTKDNRNEFPGSGDPENAKTLVEETNTGLTWMSNFRFYITQNWSAELRVEGVHLNVEMMKDTDSSEKHWNHYYDFKLGLNYTF